MQAVMYGYLLEGMRLIVQSISDCNSQQYQLMRKKLVLQVDKLVNRQPRRQVQQPVSQPMPEKKCSFEQMYKQAKKAHPRTMSSTNSFSVHTHSTPPTSSHLYQSLNASRNTPSSSARAQNDNKEKLNRSLQAKSNSLQKVQNKRNRSSDKKVSRIETKKRPSLVRKRQQRESKDEGKWEGQQQFEIEWKCVIDSLDHSKHEHLRQTECFLSLEQIFYILRALHYLRKIEDEKHLLALWQELQGETYGGIPSYNLFTFLSFINYLPSQLCYRLQKPSPSPFNHKRIVIDTNLKLIISETAKLQLYEDYLALRVNRILYGGNQASTQNIQRKPFKKTSDIKIIDCDQPQKKRIILGVRKAAEKQLSRQEKNENFTFVSEQQEKQNNQDTACNSELSQTKEGKIQTSHQTEGDSSAHQIIEQVAIKKPILSVDVNLGEGLCEKLTVFEGESAFEVSQRLVLKYKIDESLRLKFEAMLSGHIRNLLYRIDEVSEQMFSDREE